MLSIAVIVLAISAVSAIAYTQFQASRDNYNSKIQYSFIKTPVAYDYSCDENDYQIYFVIDNIGSKNVIDLSVSITNPLCEDAVPPLPASLNASSSLSFYVQSTQQNGTLTLSGNNTFVQISF